MFINSSAGNSEPFGWALGLEHCAGTEPNLCAVLPFPSWGVAGCMDMGRRQKGLLLHSQGPPYLCGKKKKSTRPGAWWHCRVRVSTDMGEESALNASQRHKERLAEVALVQPGERGASDHIPSWVVWGGGGSARVCLQLPSFSSANTQKKSQKSQMLSDFQALTGCRETRADTLPQVLPLCQALNCSGLPLQSLTTLLQEMMLNTAW